MPILGRAPTVSATRDAFEAWFAPIVREAAGRDGRLSVATAHRIAERRDNGRLASDNAVRVIEDSGQKTMSAEKLIGIEVRRLEDAAVAVAGPNQRVSLLEIRRLPRDLQDDILHLRGKRPVEPAPRTMAEIQAAVTAQVTAALDAGRATQLRGVPFGVRGGRPIVENIPHPGSNTRAIAYLVDRTIYISRASPVPSPLVGWYRVGNLED